MYELKQIGMGILMVHSPTGETHLGTIEDVKPGGWVIKMEESAHIFMDSKDVPYLDTTHSTRWTFLRLIEGSYE